MTEQLHDEALAAARGAACNGIPGNQQSACSDSLGHPLKPRHGPTDSFVPSELGVSVSTLSARRKGCPESHGQQRLALAAPR
jgi:hypothetical protein